MHPFALRTFHRLAATVAAALALLACPGSANADPPPAVWTRLPVSGPPPLVGHSLTLDPLRRRLVLYGGRNADSVNGDVWTLDLAGEAGWSRLEPAGPRPPARAWHSAAYDPVRDRVIFHGGGPAFSDLWALSLEGGGTWTLLSTSGPVPPVRQGHSAVYDAARDRMLVFGGAVDDDVWIFTPSGADQGSWSPVNSSARPHWRVGNASVHDPTRDREVIFGGSYRGLHWGYLSNLYLNDSWALDLGSVAWQSLAPAAPLPAPLYRCSSILDPVGDRLVVFGGENDSFVSDSLWVLPLANGAAWQLVHPANESPGPRTGPAAVYDPHGDRMIVYGGVTGRFGTGSYLDETWSLQWTRSLGVPGDATSAGMHLGAVRAWPVPARDRVRFGFELGRASDVALEVFDLEGRRVFALATRGEAGPQRFEWNARDSKSLASGIYFFSITARDRKDRAVASGRILLLY